MGLKRCYLLAPSASACKLYFTLFSVHCSQLNATPTGVCS